MISLVSANMRYVDMLETAICEHTGMHTYRERPEVELWVLCRPEASYFLWRLGKRSPKAGRSAPLRRLRSFGIPCALRRKECGYSGHARAARCPLAVKASGVRALTCVCPDRATAQPD